MERLQSKIEGKGNGIKTVVANLSSVAQSLARPPSYVIKYFGFELGAQTNTNPTDDRWIINGAHEATKLQDHLDGFISKFVLCKNCKNPETDVNVKDGRIFLDCKACGQRSEVDLRLKLSGFVLKNQPKKGKKAKKEKITRRDRAKAESKAGENGSLNGASPGDSHSDNADGENGHFEIGGGSDDELTRRINAEAKELEQSHKTNGAIKDDEWAVDTSAEAVAARAKELPTDVKRSLNFEEGDEDGEENGHSAYDELGAWIDEESQKRGSVSKVSDVDIYVKAKELGVETKHRTLAVLAQTIFDKNIVKQVPQRSGMLKKVRRPNHITRSSYTDNLRQMITSERHQKALLGGTERFVGKEHPELIPQVPAILLGFYQQDLVTEEVVKGWGNKASKKYVDLATSKKVRKAAEKFLEWLENADSEDEESGED